MLRERKSPRAKWHNYSGAEYFITICTKNREHFFGTVCNGTTQLTEIGKYLDEQIKIVQTRYPYAEIPLYVIMPNHIHLLVRIDGDKTPYDRRRDVACRVPQPENQNTARSDAARSDAARSDAARDVPTRGNAYMQNIANHQGWLSVCIGGIKSSVTKYANEQKIYFGWQTRFHDHIVRNQDEMNKIAEYIVNNPLKWENDCFYGK
ncbi:MAG: transposase [Bacteroidales bacterium]|nr:transposase [Bacteroidales bacterium]